MTLLFHIQMDVHLPYDMPSDKVASLKAAEREQAQELQRCGKWCHLWRIAGRYSNVSIFDVSGAEELHEILSNLPLFPFMEIAVSPLCRHPSSIREDDT